jgi:hypothetical protein
MFRILGASSTSAKQSEQRWSKNKAMSLRREL